MTGHNLVRCSIIQMYVIHCWNSFPSNNNTTEESLTTVIIGEAALALLLVSPLTKVGDVIPLDKDPAVINTTTKMAVIIFLS
jgi:hypothetical protein